jgi:acetoin utilization deacetylase AcuC-like enzyme
MPPRTALFYDERCLAHDNGSMLLDPGASSRLEVGHVESAARLARAMQVIESAPVAARIERLDSRPASGPELELVHPAAHVERLRASCERGELLWVGPEARVGANSWEAILLAAGAGVAGVDWVLADPAERNAFAMVRPPGHHAGPERAMGFCIFNNAAIAARHAQRAQGLARIAIVDWDVHHGNGTEEVFWRDPEVLFCSLHQDGLYPADRGALSDRGAGPGEGTIVNVPLPAGTGDAGYLSAFESVLTPVVERFGPELLIVSAGQDPSAADPLGRMSVTADGFRRMTAAAVELAARCGCPLLVLQEGGYSADHLPFCNLAIVEQLAGEPPLFERDPLEMDVPSGVGQREREAIAAARRAHLAG